MGRSGGASLLTNGLLMNFISDLSSECFVPVKFISVGVLQHGLAELFLFISELFLNAFYFFKSVFIHMGLKNKLTLYYIRLLNILII